MSTGNFKVYLTKNFTMADESVYVTKDMDLADEVVYITHDPDDADKWVFMTSLSRSADRWIFVMNPEEISLDPTCNLTGGVCSILTPKTRGCSGWFVSRFLGGVGLNSIPIPKSSIANHKSSVPLCVTSRYNSP